MSAEKRYAKPAALSKLRAAHASAPLRARLAPMTILWTSLLGAFFGFAFGVGCALAVMYSIYMGGYRAAVKDSQLDPPPERLTRALAKLGRG